MVLVFSRISTPSFCLFISRFWTLFHFRIKAHYPTGFIIAISKDWLSPFEFLFLFNFSSLSDFVWFSFLSFSLAFSILQSTTIDFYLFRKKFFKRPQQVFEFWCFSFTKMPPDFNFHLVCFDLSLPDTPDLILLPFILSWFLLAKSLIFAEEWFVWASLTWSHQ